MWSVADQMIAAQRLEMENAMVRRSSVLRHVPKTHVASPAKAILTAVMTWVDSVIPMMVYAEMGVE